jgi:hypothetical protein
MTPENDQGEWLHAAFVRSRDLHAPSPAPVDRILRAGRARRKRRRAMAVGAAAAAVCALAVALPLTLSDAPPSTPNGQVSATGHPSPTPTASHSAPPEPVTATVAQGVVDGHDWSVRLEYHPTLPPGFDLPEAGGTGAPSGAARAQRGKSAVLCQRMVIGGVRIDHQGGPWSDCQAVHGAHDPGGAGRAGLWGLTDKGIRGSRLFVASPEADVAYGVVTLADGTQLKGTTVAVPHTGYRAWAVAIPNGKSISTVDSYDAHDHRLDHDTDWR